MANIFLSHSSKDKNLVRRLAKDLERSGHEPWLDEWEIRVGDYIETKIEEGLSNSNFVLLFLSPNSVESGWVDREWKSRYWDEINTRQISLLPILIEDCKIPELIKSKKYADFRQDYNTGLKELLRALQSDTSIERREPEDIGDTINNANALKLPWSVLARLTSKSKVLISEPSAVRRSS